MREGRTVTLKELHAHTGRIVRGAAKAPVLVTDRGQVVAMIKDPERMSAKRRKRRILPEYAAILKSPPSDDVLDDLEGIRHR